jgi:hypothetical protein
MKVSFCLSQRLAAALALAILPLGGLWMTTARAVDRPSGEPASRPLEISGHLVDAKPEVAIVEGSIIRCEGMLDWQGVERPRMVMIKLRTERPPTDSAPSAENDGRVTIVREDTLKRSGSARWRASVSASIIPGQDEFFLEVTPLKRGYEPYRDARGRPCLWSQKVTIVARKGT